MALNVAGRGAFRRKSAMISVDAGHKHLLSTRLKNCFRNEYLDLDENRR